MVIGIKKCIYVIICLITFTSCYREKTIESPVCSNCSKSVVLCFIGLSDSIKAFVTTTYPFTKIQPANNTEFKGEVYISDSTGISVRLENSAISPRWFCTSQKSLPIVPGSLYSMKVIDENGMISTAKTRVPLVADKWSYCKFIGCQVQGDGTEICLTKCVWVKHSVPVNIIGVGKPGIDDQYNITIDFENKINILDSITRECTMHSYDFYTLYTINEAFESYMKSYSLFDDIESILWTTGGVAEMFNGIVPEYTNFDNCLGVFGAYLTDTISAATPF